RVRRARDGVRTDEARTGSARGGARKVVDELVDGRLHGGRGDEAVRCVVHVAGRMAARRAGEVVVQLGVDFIERRLHRVDGRLENVPGPADDRYRVPGREDEDLPARDVDVAGEDLGLAVRPPHVADQEL